MRSKGAVIGSQVLVLSQGLDSEQRKVVASSVIGTTVEYYDLLIYGTASALLFNKLFFPSFDPIVGTIAAFAAHSVGFLARPIGAAIFGHFGDRVGRKAMLPLTLVIMGLGTFLLGCLPTYDEVGVWAPIALVTLRLLQGIGLGGEWGGAVLMVVESVPSRRRGFFASTVQLGYPIGVVASTGAFALVSLLPRPCENAGLSGLGLTSGVAPQFELAPQARIAAISGPTPKIWIIRFIL